MAQGLSHFLQDLERKGSIPLAWTKKTGNTAHGYLVLLFTTLSPKARKTLFSPLLLYPEGDRALHVEGYETK
jgi:hypothetical protein